MADKFWNFSKRERIAAIVLTVIIVSLLATSFFEKDKDDMPMKDYKTEIEEFRSRVQEDTDTVVEKIRKPRKRTKKEYTPNKQQLVPLEKESR